MCLWIACEVKALSLCVKADGAEQKGDDLTFKLMD